MNEPQKAIALKRVYDEPEESDGRRVLVERLWPRGLSKERAHLDLWLKEVAPSHELRTWFGHDPQKWEEFRRRYVAELASGEAHRALSTLRELSRQGPLTLVFAAHNVGILAIDLVMDMKGMPVNLGVDTFITAIVLMGLVLSVFFGHEVQERNGRVYVP